VTKTHVYILQTTTVVSVTSDSSVLFRQFACLLSAVYYSNLSITVSIITTASVTSKSYGMLLYQFTTDVVTSFSTFEVIQIFLLQSDSNV